MDDKAKNKIIFILFVTIVIHTGFFVYGIYKNCGGNGSGKDSELIEEIRRLDNVVEGIGQQVRAGIGDIQTGITELKGLTESTGKRTDNITAGIGRLEKGTGKAIEYSESVNERFSRIEGIIGEMGKIIADQGFNGAGIGEDIREQVRILQKELGIESVVNDR